MKICFVCSEYPPGPHGGIGTMTQTLGRALVKAGHAVRVIGVYPRNYPAPDFEDDRGVMVWRLRQATGRLGWVVSRYRLFRQIAQWSDKSAIDLVEVPDWEGWAACWPRLRVPIIVRCHGSATYFASELGRPLKRILFHLERISMNRAEFRCSVSRYTAARTQVLLGLPAPIDVILPNAVEPAAMLEGVTRSRNQVIFSGTLTDKKGVLVLMEAWLQVSRRHPEAELHLYGKEGDAPDGRPMSAYLRTRLTELIEPQVCFHGHVERATLLQALSSARLAVFPSLAEAFAIAPLEAMAMGCPTIYSQRANRDELITHEHDGLLIDPTQPEALADAISRLLGDDALAERLGRNGREHIRQDFSIGSLVLHNVSFYQQCLNQFLAHRA